MYILRIMNKIEQLYINKRKETIDGALVHFKGNKVAESAIEKIFWSSAYADNHEEPAFFHPNFSSQKKRLEVLGFDKKDLEVENINNKYLRLQVSSNWILDLSDFNSFEEYFSLFSKKKRKNLRWLTNTYQKENFTISKIQTPEDFELFFEVYQSQFPKSKWLHCENRKALKDIFLYFEEQNINHSFILKDENGDAIAASLGYFTGDNLNFYMLARVAGKYDKLSPSNYLAFDIIRNLIENNHKGLFIFGPGFYNYKKSFKGSEYPIYRYEKKSLTNILGIIKLYNKQRKLKKEH